MRSILRPCIATAVLLAVCTAVQAADEPVVMVLNKKVFIMNRPEDVMPQAQEVADMVGERIGRKIIMKTCSEDISSVLDDLKSGGVQFVWSDGLDFARLKLGKLAQPLRAALTGSTVSPPIFEVMQNLGREESLGRIQDALRVD